MTLVNPRSAYSPDLAATTIERVDAVLARFLERKSASAAAQRLPAEATEALTGLLAAGGKRLRPVLCVTGWHAAAGQQRASQPVLQVAAALEMFHAFCLIHDDVMDHSPTRRGRPTLHRALADRHAAARPRRSADQFGDAAAILIGDLALSWSDELIHTAGLPPRQLTAVLPLLDAMRAEIMYGQYLDVAATGQATGDVDQALTVIRYKTAKYTVERPLHIGAALAQGTTRLADTLSAYALPLGEAFQLRDDLLGVFGVPGQTGKSRLDDLREGKHTVLIALALRDAPAQHTDVLRSLLGRPDLTEAQAVRVRTILTRTGARTRVEDMIARRRAHVLRLLAAPAPIHPSAVPTLRRLADATTRRTS
ncbi:polyprenyl synthetase family protein [Streptomyces varsoviensis]|uniref:polyprenyl synthetase family protein n=1 Tax=Streptomyces varsoviensis TaxID=67373 RepID=UPI003F4D2D1F